MSLEDADEYVGEAGLDEDEINLWVDYWLELESRQVSITGTVPRDLELVVHCEVCKLRRSVGVRLYDGRLLRVCGNCLPTSDVRTRVSVDRAMEMLMEEMVELAIRDAFFGWKDG